jgi:ferric-dicitrate binding protein FerR (iron transport regulator)/tetratricopeptide (TPR) repeat protein
MAMTHDEALLLLSARLDGPLTGDQQQALESWQTESPDNQILAEAFRTQHGELLTTFEPRRDAARSTAAAVAKQLANDPTPAPERPAMGWRRLFISPWFAGCAAALLLAIGLFVFRRDGSTIIDEHPNSLATATSDSTVGLRARERKVLPQPLPAAIGDTIATLAGEKKRVTLPDGSLLYLNQNTKVTLPKDRHVKLESGEVYLEAIPAKSESERFTVETPKRSVTALGTKFAVSTNDKGTGVLVTQGKVKVEGMEQKLTSGQELLAGGEKIASAPRASAALEWTRDLMVAAESPLVPAGKHSGGSLVAVDPYGQEAKLSLVKFHVDVHIEDGFARTTIDQTYFNSENSRMEGTFYFPLPPDGSLSRLAMYVDGDLMEGGMAEREHARDVYERIRYQNRDPALLEWVDGSVFKMRVFPLEARQEKRIVLSYTQRLPVLYGQATYRFPSGHTLALVDKWSFNAVIKDGARISASSPSHPAMKLTPQGQDLVMTDEAKNVKVDRDVVLSLHDHQAQAQAETFHWSQGELDGQKYLMVRYRPDLPSAPRRERRDWVFLFESSGARDPLVARAQVEVIRGLLTHAETDDTFSVLSVGTRVRNWAASPQAATGENIAKAITWLESRHLVGALNLDQALSDVTPILQAGSNPHLVHVGGGIASIGEQRADVLVKRIPAGTKYVGIGVGKKFSPAFMKVAAERTGGLFTQVNPDEPIGWRGFEIASTLNAPRLLNVQVETPGVNAVRFLTFSNVLAHGEEFAAVANVTHATPQAVVVRGTLDGQAFEKKLVVSNVAPGAGYLPRTWAKLEIDRMLAADSQVNQKAITELSKAMYVMTPFTSLLVLENEAMYKEFKVDRGRKDHWAMYPCPAKIPVVYIPDPNQPAGSRPDLKGQKPHENSVLQTILVRNSPRYLTAPGEGGGVNPIETAGQRFGTYFAMPVEQDKVEDLAVEYFAEGDMDGPEMPTRLGASRTLGRSAGDGWGLKGVNLNRVLSNKDAKQLKDSLAFAIRDREAPDNRPVRVKPQEVRLMMLDDLTTGISREKNLQERNDLAKRLHSQDLDMYMKRMYVTAGHGSVRYRSSSTAFGTTTRFDVENADLAVDFAMPALQTRGEGLDESRKKLKEVLKRESGRAGDFRRSVRTWNETNGVINSRFLESLAEVEFAVGDPMSRAGDRQATPDEKDGGAIAQNAGYFAYVTSAPRYYGRPSFNGNHRVFTDLVSYAPGMSSSPADIRAALEAEAAPRFGSRVGSIDPAARKLIENARSSEWRVLKLSSAEGKSVAFHHDGQGRYAYERQVGLGLRERVVCDGTHLWHLYPELGIGAKRVVSRFHRAQLFDLIPDYLPPADDLAYGADVKLVNENTVALSPIRPAKLETEPEAWLELHLVFDGVRLTERQWVLRVNEKPNDILIRETYSAGETKLLASTVADAKPISLWKRESTRLNEAPNLSPDLSNLVVLPLPLRSREHVYQSLGMEAGWDLFQDRNACFEYFTPDEAMQLLGCEFAAGNGHNVSRVWSTCFASRNDHRTGFFTLMASADYNPRSHRQFNDKFEKNPSDPLVRYLWQMHDSDIHDWQARFGFAPGRSDADSFIGKLTSFRRVVARWQGAHITHGLWGQRDTERQRVLDFAERNADNVLGWCTLAMVHDRASTAEAWAKIAETWGVLAKKSSFPYQARYEEARSLGHAGKSEEAQDKYQKLFADALAEGLLPPLDSSFRSVLENGKQDAWAKLMRETAAKCAEKKARPVIVTLAWQCYQLGDTAMADTLLELALKDVPANEKAFTSIAAISFLNSSGRYDRADKIVRELLSDPELAKSAGLWRLASQTADNRKDPVRGIECLEKALDIEYARIPDVFDVQPIRNDYSRLLSHYEWLADAAASLKVDPPKDLNTRVVKAADRWRHLDGEAKDVPNRVATILRKAGGEGARELAWDYATTPLALKPNESDPWVSLAWSVRQEGDWRLADKCYELAFAAEPTNAQLLWDRAQHLQQQGQIAESRKLMKQLADSEWQPRFSGLKAQAKQAVEGR